MRKSGVALLIILAFLVTIVGEPMSNEMQVPYNINPATTDDYSLSDWDSTNAGTGYPLSGTIFGSKTSYGTSVIDRTRAGYIGVDSPLGWSSEYLEGQLDHLSYWVDSGLVNPTLNANHEEHWFFSGGDSLYNGDPFYVPDGWTIIKFDTSDGTQHPQHGTFEMNAYPGNGYDNSMGWRFDVNPDSGTTFEPTNMMYFSQQIPRPWRSVYSAEITFRYYVSSTSILDDDVFIFTRLEDYTLKHHVFLSGTPMDTWFQTTATVPSSYFQSVDNLDSLIFDIGLGTDISGQPGSSVHEVYIDDVELRLLVRPFPEKIGLRANGAFVTGSTRGSVSPYVPDGANRDCYSGITSNGVPAGTPGPGGVDLNGYSDNGVLEVGADVPLYPDWTTANAYQVGLQFPLNVPQGAVIESAFLEVEAVSTTNLPDMRVYVADEDNVAAFTSESTLLPDKYNWASTSVYWHPTAWGAGSRPVTPDISALIQDVVSRPGWQSGNYICIMIGYAYSNQQYAYNQIKGSTGFAQADLARLFVNFIEVESGDTIPSFQYNKKIIIDHTKVESDLQDFPVLLDIWDKDLHLNTQPDGDDIAFMFKNQIIPHEIELFDKKGNGTHAHLICWVKVPYLSSFNDTAITMVYGDSEVGAQENPTAVWDDNYIGVWHLSQDPGPGGIGDIKDSTQYGNNGTAHSSMLTADLIDAKIDGGLNYDGIDDNVIIPHTTLLDITGDLTLDIWVWYDAFGTWDYFIGKGDDGASDVPYCLQQYNTAGVYSFDFTDSSNIWRAGIPADTTLTSSSWYKLTVTFRVSDRSYRYYLNGAPDGGPYIAGGFPDGSNLPVGLGADGVANMDLDGRLDEARISNIVRTADWISTEFNNQYDPGSFYTVEPQAEQQPDVQVSDFRYKKDIVVDHTKVSTDLTDFPMLIDIYDTGLRTHVQDDADDLMFKSGYTWLPHEIAFFDKTFNGTHAHLIAWVKTDLSSSFDTIITMYYGNPNMTSQEDSRAVWGNYVGAWHLDESPIGIVYDSSPYNNDGVTLGSMSGSDLVPGQIGSGFDLDGIDDMINVPQSLSLDSIKSAGTISLWINWLDSSDGGYQRVLTTSDRFDPPNIQVDGFELSVQPDGDNYFYPWGGNSIDYNLATNPFVNGIWHHLAVTLDYSTKSVVLYLDGMPLSLTIENVPTQWTQLASLDNWLWGGNDVITNSQFQGKFDEIRVTNAIRSAGWMLTEYNNQYDPNSFYSVELEEQVSGIEIVFTTSSESSITIGVQLALGVQTSTSTYAEDFTLGTSFSVVNESLPIWTAGVLISPPAELDAVSFEISYPEGDWWPYSVTSPTGIEIAYSADWICFGGKLAVSSTAVEEYGMWQIRFLDRNHVLDTQMGLAGGPYATTSQFSIGEDIQFRVWSSGTIGSTISLELTNPSGATWYTGNTTFQGERFTLPYYHRKQLTISHTNVADDLVNFPVLVDIYDTNLRTDVRPDGRDIAFAIGEETLSHEIELFDQSYNSSHAHLVAWVKVPLLSGSSDTVISMYYDNPLAPIVYSSGSVWDSDYVG
ncbi:MAG: LamG-like jellyroll fold domain-containing protein, partial [Candidatus Thorarchaeota archaeon]